jgi:type IV secretory pathway VirB10-like protein
MSDAVKKYLFYPLFIAIMSWIAVKAFHRDHKLKTSTPKDPVPQETDVVTETPAQPHPETSSAPIPEASSTPNPEVSDTPITPDAPIPQETDTSPLSPQTTQNISPIQLRLQQSYRPDEEKAVKKILQEELKVDDVRALINSSQSVRGPESPGLRNRASLDRRGKWRLSIGLSHHNQQPFARPLLPNFGNGCPQ